MAPPDRVEGSWSIEPVPFPIVLVTAVATAGALVVNMGSVAALAVARVTRRLTGGAATT